MRTCHHGDGFTQSKFALLEARRNIPEDPFGVVLGRSFIFATNV